MSGAGQPWLDYQAPSTASAQNDNSPWLDYAPIAPTGGLVSPHQSVASPAPKSTFGSLAGNLLSGVERGGLGLIGSFADAMDPIGTAAKLTDKAYQDTTGKRLLPDRALESNAERFGEGLGLIDSRLNPATVQPKTWDERLSNNIGVGLSGILIPGAEGASLANLGRSATMGVTSGVGSDLAQEAVSDPYKPIAGLLGGLAGGVAGNPEMAVNAARNVARPFAASVSPAAAERMAGDTLASKASDPQAVLQSLANGNRQIVPGSEPTTFQATGDLGLGSLERGTATNNPDLFAARRADQNSARLSSLAQLAPDANPGDFSSFLKNQFNSLDADTASHVGKLTTTAKDTIDSLGNPLTPEAHGAVLRGILQDAENGARGRERTLWNAIDPDGSLTGNVIQTKVAANDIRSAIPPTAKPQTGEEAGIFDAASSLPPLSPVSDLIALRSRVSTEMRNELVTNGQSASYARLARLRGAIQDNLANSITEHVGQQQAAGVPLEDSTAARIQGWVNDYRANKAAAAGTGSFGGPTASTPFGASASISPNGAGVSPEGGLGSPASNQGLPPNAGAVGIPSFDTAAADRLQAATDATKVRASTFNRGPVSATLAKAGPQDLYRLPDGNVAAKFFQPGNAGYNNMQSAIAAGGDQAVPVLRDYAAMTLRRFAQRADGTIDPDRFQAWQAKHSDALRAFPPNVQKQFANVGTASSTLDDAVAARTDALKQAQAGTLGKIMNATAPQDVTRMVASVFGGKDSVAQMRSLVSAARGNPDALAGLKQAVSDHIAGRFISNTEVGASGDNAIKADQFQTFLRQNKPALSQVYTPQQINSLTAIAADLHRSARSVNAVKLPGGSNTAQDILAATQGARPSVLRVLLDLGAAGAGAQVTHNWMGAVAAGLGAYAVQAIRGAGIRNAQDLVTRAMLNPDLAEQLLRPSLMRGRPTWSQALTRSLLASTPAAVVATNRSSGNQ